MKNRLQTQIAQRLTLTPQLRQAIRILQMTSLELETEVAAALEENPFLEAQDAFLDSSVRFSGDGSIIGEDRSAEPDSTLVDSASLYDGSLFSDANTLDYSPMHPESSRDDDNCRFQVEGTGITLREHLLEQANLSECGERERLILEFLIDAVDDSGFLGESFAELVPWLSEEYGITAEEIEEAVSLLQTFDPPGVGARTGSECLSIQIAAMDVPDKTRAAALAVVKDHLAVYARRDFAKLRKDLKLSREELEAANALILRCNPSPGSPFATAAAETLIPEIVAVRDGDTWKAALNPDAIPKIRVSSLSADVPKHAQGRPALAEKIRQARWLVSHIRQRFETILRVSGEIIARQQRFFTEGPAALNPLVLQEIADKLELHESTVSRVTTGKFMHTPLGIFELKYFFGNRITTTEGGETSSTAIREKLKNLIAAEDKKKPYSDSRLAELLEAEGFPVARRTVAKYRDMLKIAPASLRKSI